MTINHNRPRIARVIRFWRGLSFWEKLVFAITHPVAAFHLQLLSEADRKAQRELCNGGRCQRWQLGAEPCTDCPYCDEEGNL